MLEIQMHVDFWTGWSQSVDIILFKELIYLLIHSKILEDKIIIYTNH